MHRLRGLLLVALVTAGTLATACTPALTQSGSNDIEITPPTFRGGAAAPSDIKIGNCIVLDITVSPEKIDLLNDLANTFNASADARVNNKCIAVRPQSQSSGAAMQALADGWNEATEGPAPVVWSPAGSTWGAILNQRLADKSQPAMTGAGKTVHGDAARHRHAQADGRSARISAQRRSAGPTS